ncbi:dynamin family protein [Streptomyces phaeofaciens JCM 4814]|uniref:Dynamin n=1 Tax=Streptomyces phaeofaciens TaxID=68254 RepID=A0A918H2M7_9ACTN|nr:dynamin family protein [Streptomyces phaeofaciens]GGT32689.1 dynamin [Streptomyces phaeofaciens]
MTPAPPSSDFAGLVEAVLALLDRAAAVPELTADGEGWEQVARTGERLRGRAFLIAVCGEFSSGKSTLLGALLGRPELFPADVGATTSVPTVVGWAEREQVRVITREQPEGVLVGAADLTRHVTEAGNPGNARQVVEVRIGLPVPLLRDGVHFVDLPGIGSTNAAHALVTNAYLERIDAALFVSAAQTVGESELAFLRRVTERVGDALVIARSKADLVAQYGEEGVARAVADVRAKAAEALRTAPGDLVVVPVSALTSLMALGDPEEEEASGIPSLAESIDTAIAARAGSLLAAATLTGLDAALGSAQERLGLRLKALTDGNSPEIMAVREELDDRRRHLDEVTASEAGWTARMRGELERICTDETMRLDSGLHGVKSRAQAALDGAGHGLDANAFTSTVVNQVHDHYTTAARRLEQRANEALEATAVALDLDLGRLQVDDSFHGTRAASFHEPVVPRRAKSDAGRALEAGSRAARKGGFWKALGAGLAVGATLLFPPAAFAAAPLLGAVAAAAAGTAAGGLADAAFGFRGELEEMERADLETRRSRLRKHVIEALAPNQEEARARLRSVVPTLQNGALAALRSALAREKNDVGARVAQLSRDLQRTRAEADAEAVRLRPALTALKALAEDTAALRARVAQQRGRLRGWGEGAGGERDGRESTAS